MRDWRKNTSQAYRRGYVEGQEGQEDALLLRSGLTSESTVASYHASES